MNYLNKNIGEEATHVGVAVSHEFTKYENGIVIIHNKYVSPDKIKFIFYPTPKEEQRPGPIESKVYLIKDDRGWRIPGTHVIFNYIDGEMDNGSKNRMFSPIYLDLSTVKEL